MKLQQEDLQTMTASAKGRGGVRRHRGGAPGMPGSFEFSALNELTSDTVARYDRQLQRTYANMALSRVLGQPLPDLLGRRPSESRDTPAARAYEAVLQEALESAQERDYTYQYLSGDGRPVTSHIHIVPERDAQGVVTSVLAIGRDVTTMEASMRHLRVARSVAHMCTWEIDFGVQPPSVSVQGLEVFGLGDEHMELSRFLALVPGDQRRALKKQVRAALRQGATSFECEHLLSLHEGSDQRDVHSWVQFEYGNRGQLQLASGVTQDVTPVKQLQRQTHQLAYFDPLTNLPNRNRMLQRLQEAIAEAGPKGASVGLVLIDLDHFQKVNDSLGHRQGDELLREVAGRLSSTLRDHDTIARLGADEFAVVVARMRQSADLERVGERIKQALAQPIELANTRVQVTVSAGVAVYPDDGSDVDELFTHADAAMNHAKTQGRNNFQFYARKLTDEARERLILEADLAQALERKELMLFYQPKVRLRNAEIVGTEALMRWRHAQRGLIPPDRFIRVAEESGLIMDIGRWALHSACASASRWNQGRATPLKVAVNLSPRQFQGGDLVGTVQDALERHQCRAQWIELEITEGLLLNDREDIRAQLAALHRLGTTIAVDDFGTGYSALSYLTRFPIDTLKVDRSFIRELGENTESAVLTRAIVALGQSLLMEVVAEGVETETQRDCLGAFACELAQGYLYGKPMPEDEFTALLQQGL